MNIKKREEAMKAPVNVIVTAAIDTKPFVPLMDRINLVKLIPLHQGGSLLDTEAAPYLADADVIICELDIVNESVLARARNLSLVIVCRSTPVNVDCQACANHHVEVITTPGRNADSTADLTVALILASLRKVDKAESWLRNATWDEKDTY